MLVDLVRRSFFEGLQLAAKNRIGMAARKAFSHAAKLLTSRIAAGGC